MPAKLSSRHNLVGRAKIVGPSQRISFNIITLPNVVNVGKVYFYFGGGNISVGGGYPQLYKDDEFFAATSFTLVDNGGQYVAANVFNDRKTGGLALDGQIVGKTIDYFTFNELIKREPYLCRKLTVQLITVGTEDIDFILKTLLTFENQGINIIRNEGTLHEYIEPMLVQDKGGQTSLVIDSDIIFDANNGFGISINANANLKIRALNLSFEMLPINI